MIENFARRLQVCRQRISWNVHKNDNVALRDLKLGGKIMHKLYFVRNKVQLITDNISRLIRIFDMLLFRVTLYKIEQNNLQIGIRNCAELDPNLSTKLCRITSEAKYKIKQSKLKIGTQNCAELDPNLSTKLCRTRSDQGTKFYRIRFALEHKIAQYKFQIRVQIFAA